MKLTLALVAVALTGCAGMEPLTPEQAAVLMYMNHRSYVAPAPVYQPVQPTYAPQANPWPVQPMRPVVRCVTTDRGYSLYTTCQ